MTKNKKRALIVVGILISVGFLWLALRGTDFAEISRALANSSLWMVLSMLAQDLSPSRIARARDEGRGTAPPRVTRTETRDEG